MTSNETTFNFVTLNKIHSEVSSWFSVWALPMNRYTLNLHLSQRKSAIHPLQGNFWGNVFLTQFEKIPQIAQDSKINNKQQTHAFARFRFSS